MSMIETILDIINFFLWRNPFLLLLFAEIKYNIDWETKKIDTEPQRSHKSGLVNAEYCSFDIRRLIPTPTAVIATTKGKWEYNQIEYIAILPFSLRICIGNLLLPSKYNHHKLKDMHNPSDETITE